MGFNGGDLTMKSGTKGTNNLQHDIGIASPEDGCPIGNHWSV